MSGSSDDFRAETKVNGLRDCGCSPQAVRHGDQQESADCTAWSRFQHSGIGQIRQRLELIVAGALHNLPDMRTRSRAAREGKGREETDTDKKTPCQADCGGTHPPSTVALLHTTHPARRAVIQSHAKFMLDQVLPGLKQFVESSRKLPTPRQTSRTLSPTESCFRSPIAGRRKHADRADGGESIMAG